MVTNCKNWQVPNDNKPEHKGNHAHKSWYVIYIFYNHHTHHNIPLQMIHSHPGMWDNNSLGKLMIEP